MGVFHVFEIVQIVPCRAKHHRWSLRILWSQYKRFFNSQRTSVLVMVKTSWMVCSANQLAGFYWKWKLNLNGSTSINKNSVQLFEVYSENTRKMRKSLQQSKDTRTMSLTWFWCLYCFNFEQILRIALMFSLLTLSKSTKAVSEQCDWFLIFGNFFYWNICPLTRYYCVHGLEA